MILFPNCKINLGLRILGKRPDGFHDIATAMVPVPGWSDVLELIPARSSESTLTVTGHALTDCPPEKNLVMKALRAVEAHIGRSLPTDIYLRKIVPDGAGLGGGSSDAAFTVLGLNELYSLGLSRETMASIASGIGSDCPFFIYNRPMLATGRGTELTPIDINLQGAGAILIAKPLTDAVSTREAYAGVRPEPLAEDEDLSEILLRHPAEWAPALRNDFETSIFPLRPAIAAMKDAIAASGAIYTAMSGSGAAVFGLYPDLATARHAQSTLPPATTYLGTL